MSWPQRIEQALAERRLNAAYRRRQTTEGGNGRQIRLGDRLYLNFSGNDYLGLSQDARVIAAWQQGRAALRCRQRWVGPCHRLLRSASGAGGATGGVARLSARAAVHLRLRRQPGGAGGVDAERRSHFSRSPQPRLAAGGGGAVAGRAAPLPAQSAAGAGGSAGQTPVKGSGWR